MSFLHPLLAIIGFISLAIAAGYATLTLIAALAWGVRRDSEPSGALRPVTVLKPLCGAEPGLYEYLRSFCEQDYPAYQIVFGLRDSTDPAHAVARRVADEFPHLPITIVINPQLHGSNCKISNLINMYPHAQNDVLVMADSDALVGPDYLASVTSPLEDPKVGLVTCMYRGIPTPPIWSRLGAMYINEWYAPSVLLAWLFGHQGYVSGQTVSLRRGTLEIIGGLEALTDQLADDMDWSTPSWSLIAPQFDFDGTNGLTYQCSWTNTTDEVVSFGESALDEMCFVGGYYYPSQGMNLCLDGQCRNRP